jgi:phosphohistidine phosphatase
MRVLLIRHAIAVDGVAFAANGGTDAQRPLTEFGRKRMRKGANRLRFQVPVIDVLACSTLLRASETAQIVARAFSDLPILERNDLAPGSQHGSLLTWLAGLPAGTTVALVGHQPHLGMLAGTFVSGIPTPLIAFKKGGAALFEFADSDVRAGSGILRWALTPNQLRSLKE